MMCSLSNGGLIGRKLIQHLLTSLPDSSLLLTAAACSQCLKSSRQRPCWAAADPSFRAGKTKKKEWSFLMCSRCVAHPPPAEPRSPRW